MADQRGAISEPVCSKCKSSRTSRVKRMGLWHALVSRLGFFPWECTTCRKVFYARTRGKLKRRRSREGEAHLPPVG